jgi:UDP-N-acetylglucosamine/UDP-N-acetylgalactosamine 4-epimerase
VIQANLLAALADAPGAANQVYNVALNERTSLNELHAMMCRLLADQFPHVRTHQPQYGAFRPGDVRHSQADISKAQALLGFAPTHRIGEGMQEALHWYIRNLTQNN